MTGSIDQIARDGVTKALARIEMHEAVCTERWNDHKRSTGELQTSLTAVRKGVEGLYDRLWYAACALIGLLTVCVGTLVLEFFLHK